MCNFNSNFGWKYTEWIIDDEEAKGFEIHITS